MATEPKDSIKPLLKDLRREYKRALREKLPLDYASWGYEEGALMPWSTLAQILDHVEELRDTLHKITVSTDSQFAEIYGFGEAHKRARKLLNLKVKKHE